MSDPAAQHRFSGLSRLKLFWALSRTPHGLLDMCTPVFAALLWLGGFPSVEIILVGLLTTFAGYTATCLSCGELAIMQRNRCGRLEDLIETRSTAY